jgi:hypothetical protein
MNQPMRDSGAIGNPDGRLEDQIALLKLLPTPAAGLHNYEESVESFTARQEKLKAKGINGNGAGTPLPIALKLLPTPQANDGKADLKWSGKGFGPCLEELVLSGRSTDRPFKGGKPSTDLRLSPWFVEWMMGAPEGWSDPACPLSATEFASTWATSPGDTSSNASGSE